MDRHGTQKQVSPNAIVDLEVCEESEAVFFNYGLRAWSIYICVSLASSSTTAYEFCACDWIQLLTCFSRAPDHLLSFFLGNDGHHQTSTTMPDFASTKHALHLPSNRTTMQSSDNMKLDEDEDNYVPPPTPAMQFYAPNQHLSATSTSQIQSNRMMAMGPGEPHQMFYSTSSNSLTHQLPGGALTSSSSSSSLGSIQAALVSGGPLIYSGQMHHHNYAQNPHLHQYSPPLQPQESPKIQSLSISSSRRQQGQNSQKSLQQQGDPVANVPPRSPGQLPSPISPAALIGSGYENLMLPPANRAGSCGPSPELPYQTLTSIQHANISDQERHLAWLRDLNAMAKQAQGGPQQAPQYTQHQEQSSQEIALLPLSNAQVAMTQNHMMYQSAGMITGMPPGKVQESKPSVETAEKRAKRLERNRESARKSRLRKKDRLTTLEAQVSVLHGGIEDERRNQINCMVKRLRMRRNSELTSFVSNDQGTDTAPLMSVLRSTGPDSDIVRAVQDFQHNALKQLVQPSYQKILLWFTLHNGRFFFAGKDEYANREATSKMTPRSTPGKVSSKQIGDELTNGSKESNEDTITGKRVTFQDTSSVDDDAISSDQPNLTPYANDAARVWPLFCFELGLSADLEEKFILTHKRVKAKADLSSARSQMAAAVTTSNSLGEATLSLGRVIAQREARTLGQILLPEQVVAFKGWLAANRQHCAEIVSRRRTTEDFPTDSSLHDICKRLNEVLKISMSGDK
jgi:hypothetical protein